MIYTFGPFKLLTTQRVLERDGVPCTVGSRSLDILTLLVEQAGALVSKEELIAHTWPTTVVEDSSLRVHVAALRKALQDDEGLFIRNVPGRGYCFVAAVERLEDAGPLRTAAVRPVQEQPRRPLPVLLARLIGRDSDVADIRDAVLRDRFVSIIASGGVGKTSVAVAVGHALADEFCGEVVFVDLSALNDPALVYTTVVRALGLEAQFGDPLAYLVEYLRQRRQLIILDNCEHVIEHATILSETVLSAAADIHILATSREALRATGEAVYNLQPLESPAPGEDVSVADIDRYSALQMFFEKAAAGGMRASPSMEDVAKVANICSRLDGVPLALELAAGRVAAYGIDGIIELLENRFRLQWRGRRAAMARHQTLRSMFDWSYNLLDERERFAFRYMSAFAGGFRFEAALAVALPPDCCEAEMFDICEGLASKSLISIHYSAVDGQYYRLSETARAYAGERLAENELDVVLAKGRHAKFHAESARKIDGAVADFRTWSRAGITADLLANIRVALAWSFDRTGERKLGMELLASAWMLFTEPALLRECFNWAVIALDGEEGGPPSPEIEASICEALTFTGILIPSATHRVRTAARRCIELSEQLGMHERQLRVLAAYHVFEMRLGNNREGLQIAQRFEHVASIYDKIAVMRIAGWMRGTSEAYLGNFAGARELLERSLPPPQADLDIDFLGFMHLVRARMLYARTLWVQGNGQRAVQTAMDAIAEARSYRNPICLCIAISHGAGILIWEGDIDSAERITAELVDEASKYGLQAFRALGTGLMGQCMILRGELEAGQNILRDAIHHAEEEKHANTATALLEALAQSYLAVGLTGDALSLADRAIARAEETGELFQLADLHRLRAVALWTHQGDGDQSKALDAFRQAIDIAGNQSAPAWRLKAACDMVEITAGSEDHAQSRVLLSEILSELTGGYEGDLSRAKTLLQGASEYVL